MADVSMRLASIQLRPVPGRAPARPLVQPDVPLPSRTLQLTLLLTLVARPYIVSHGVIEVLFP